MSFVVEGKRTPELKIINNPSGNTWLVLYDPATDETKRISLKKLIDFVNVEVGSGGSGGDNVVGFNFSDTFIPTLGQTVFTLNNPTALNEKVLLFLNGLQQDQDDNYTVLGTTLTWLNGTLDNQDEIEINYNGIEPPIVPVPVPTNTVPIYTFKVLITSAQILAMKYSDTPIEVVPNPGVGYSIELITASCKVLFNSIPYSTNDDLYFSSLPNPSGIAVAQLFIGNALGATLTREIGGIKSGFGVGFSSIVENAAIVVSTGSGYTLNGNSDIIVYGTYRKKQS